MVNRYNAEGYYDPTAYEALRNIEWETNKRRYRPLVFVSSPFAGDTEKNIINARRFCKFTVENGGIPFAPHLLFPQFMDDTDYEERNLGILFGMVFMAKCAEMWVFGEQLTNGMKTEISKARARGLPIRFVSTEEVLRHESVKRTD